MMPIHDTALLKHPPAHLRPATRQEQAARQRFTTTRKGWVHLLLQFCTNTQSRQRQASPSWPS